MTAAESAELTDCAAAGRLPTTADAEWQTVPYAQFLRDAPAENAIYEQLS